MFARFLQVKSHPPLPFRGPQLIKLAAPFSFLLSSELMKSLTRAFRAGLKGFVAGFRAPLSEPERVYPLRRSNQTRKPGPNYSAEQRARFSKEYGVAARAYRFRQRACVAVGLVSILGGSLAMPFSRHVIVFCFGTAFLAVMIGMVMEGFPPPCTGCKEPVDFRFGPFCPQCGDMLEPDPDDAKGAPICLTCDRSLYCERGRNYRIRNCTHCGVLLDIKGV
jgi:hypothetical protein